MVFENYKVPHCGAFPTPHSHSSDVEQIIGRNEENGKR